MLINHVKTNLHQIHETSTELQATSKQTNWHFLQNQLQGSQREPVLDFNLSAGPSIKTSATSSRKLTQKSGLVKTCNGLNARSLVVEDNLFAEWAKISQNRGSFLHSSQPRQVRLERSRGQPRVPSYRPSVTEVKLYSPRSYNQANTEFLRTRLADLRRVDL